MTTLEVSFLLLAGFAVTVGCFIGGGWFVLFVFVFTTILAAIFWAIRR